eukprot:scaffold3661_cov403-Prasinococcus_capsulatus_cf.AAC.7
MARAPTQTPKQSKAGPRPRRAGAFSPGKGLERGAGAPYPGLNPRPGRIPAPPAPGITIPDCD